MRRRLRSAAFPIHRHAVPQVALDAGLVALAYYLAYRLRFDGGIPSSYFDLFQRTIAFAVFGSLVCFVIVGMYRHWMRYSSQREYLKIAEGTVLAVLALIALRRDRPAAARHGARAATSRWSVPAGVLVLFGLLMGAFLTGTRYVVHFFYVRPISGRRARRDARTVLIVGAGNGGHLLLNELLKNPELGYRPVGFVDDDERKQGMREVLGTTYDLDEVLEDVEPDEVLIAIPSASGELRGRVVSACRERGVPVRTDPDGVRAAADRRPAHAPAARGARRGRARAATRCGWRSSPSAATSPAGACSSPARAVRSAPRSAARSPG